MADVTLRHVWAVSSVHMCCTDRMTPSEKKIWFVQPVGQHALQALQCSTGSKMQTSYLLLLINMQQDMGM